MRSQGTFLNKEGKKYKCVFFVAPEMKSVKISYFSNFAFCFYPSNDNVVFNLKN